MEKDIQAKTEEINIITNDIKDFVFDRKVNIDILRKCFLMQVQVFVFLFALLCT